ncbi:MAG: hypothetical protein ABW178_05460 [Pseudoxanthomonas sp.]
MGSQYATEQQLAALLDQLERDLPELVSDHPSPGEFWNAFMLRVDAIEASAAPDDGRILPRLNAMLKPHGMQIASVD